MGLHTYKICVVLPRDPEQKMGRPRRDVVIGWKGLTLAEVNLLRSVQEPRLEVGQFAELDGKIVARAREDANVELNGDDAGDADAANDVDDADDAREAGIGDTEDASHVDGADDMSDVDDIDAGPSPEDPVAVTKHATRMLWDAYRRHAAASAELREQTNELNRRAIAQAKQLDEALSAIQNRPAAAPAATPPPPPLNVSLDDLVNAFRIGASIFRDVSSNADKTPPK
jgi:hypothetical protein